MNTFTDYFTRATLILLSGFTITRFVSLLLPTGMLATSVIVLLYVLSVVLTCAYIFWKFNAGLEAKPQAEEEEEY